MTWAWQTGSRPLDGSDQAAGELFLILAEQHPQVLAAKFKERSFPSLQQNVEGLALNIGFQGEQGQKPYVLVSWPPGEQGLLERRWVWSQAIRRLKRVLDFHKIVAFTDQGQSMLEQRVLAEDLLTFSHSRQDTDQRLEHIEICSLTDLEQSWLKVQDNRFQHRLEYADWINESPDSMTSIAIGERLRSFASAHNCSFEELAEDRLHKERMNLLLAVGAASENSPPRCYVLGHKLDSKKAPLMLVGKGITYDTGGINVKPFESHVNAMRNDMGGAALMSHLFMALVKGGYDGPLVLLIPSCENAVSAKSMKPGSQIVSRQGKLVYVEHTDAEGRLILADAIDYGESLFSPTLTLVAATLTTAALRQFTNYVTPVYFANEKFQTSLQEMGRLYGEKFIFWEEFKPFHKANQSQYGDLTNMGRLPHHANIGGGSNVAAHFLKSFARGPLIHFDIFASAWNWSGDYPGSVAGATGAPFNSIFAALMNSNGVLWGY